MVSATGDLRIVQGPKRGQFHVTLLGNAATTVDSTGWIDISGAKDMVFFIQGFDPNATATVNSGDIRIRVHNAPERPNADDNGIDVYGPATQDVVRYLAGSFHWVKANMVRVTSIDQWASGTSMDVFLTGTF